MNLQIKLGRIITLTKVGLPMFEHRLSLHLSFRYSLILSLVFQFSAYIFCSYFVRFTPEYFSILVLLKIVFLNFKSQIFIADYYAQNICVPKNSYFEVPTLIVTLFGDRAFMEIIKVKRPKGWSPDPRGIIFL